VTDKDAKARRTAVRRAHFAGIKPMVERGELRAAGAILDEAGEMIGSVVLAEFPNRADLDAWLAREPYVGRDARQQSCGALPFTKQVTRSLIIVWSVWCVVRHLSCLTTKKRAAGAPLLRTRC
jgi:uncharacterized protein YciI